jgi:hypothetical protein
VQAEPEADRRVWEAPHRTLIAATRAVAADDGGNAPMATLDEKDRDKLRKDQFAYVDKDGEGHLPINDESHIRNAMARWNQTEFESKAAKERARKKIVGAAKRHGIEVDEDDKVAKASR